MIKFKASLIQLFALVTMAAAAAQMAMLPVDREPFWKQSGPLRYERPTVPDAFKALTKQPVTIQFSKDSEIRYQNPEELYVCNYKYGWESYRSLFYKDDVWQGDVIQYHFYDEYDLSKLSFRSDIDHAFLAQYHGRMKCRDQVGELLLEQSASQLRRQIAYSPNWIYAPGLVVFSFAFVVFVRSARNR